MDEPMTKELIEKAAKEHAKHYHEYDAKIAGRFSFIAGAEFMQEYAAQQVTAERERVKELLDVLDHIANPVARLQKLAEEEGKQLNGIMALMITSDAHYYKNIAKTALEKYKLIDK